MNLFLVVLSKICKSRKKLFPYEANFSKYCQSNFGDSGKAKFRNNLIGKSFVDNAVWIVDAGYALMLVIPKDEYRISFNNSFRWIPPDRTLKAAEILIKEYHKKKGRRK